MAFSFTIHHERMAAFNHQTDATDDNDAKDDNAAATQLACPMCHEVVAFNSHFVCQNCSHHLGA